MDQGPTGQPMSQPPAAGSGGMGGGLNQDLSRQMADLRKGFKFGDFMTFRFMITPPMPPLPAAGGWLIGWPVGPWSMARPPNAVPGPYTPFAQSCVIASALTRWD